MLGLNAPLGHAVSVIQHQPLARPVSSTDRVHAILDRIAHPEKHHLDALEGPGDDPEPPKPH